MSGSSLWPCRGSVDLIGLASQYVTPQLIGQIAGAAGLDSTTAEEPGRRRDSFRRRLIGQRRRCNSRGGAQKIADAVSNADPDLLTKLSSAAGTIQNQMMTDGAGKLGALIGANGLSGLAAALSAHSGADQSTARLAIGAVAQALIGALGQQDPSLWSDGGAIGALFASQTNAIAAALPTDLAKSLGASGLLQGLGCGGRRNGFERPRRRKPGARRKRFERFPGLGDRRHRADCSGGALLVLRHQQRTEARRGDASDDPLRRFGRRGASDVASGVPESGERCKPAAKYAVSFPGHLILQSLLLQSLPQHQVVAL